MKFLQQVQHGGRWSALCGVGGSLAVVLLLGLGLQPHTVAAAGGVAVYVTAPGDYACNDPSGTLCDPTKNGPSGQQEVLVGHWSDVKQTATPVVNIECTSFQIGEDTQYALIEDAYTTIRLEDPADAATFVEYKSNGYERIRSQVAGCNGGSSGTTVPIPIIEETTYGDVTYRAVPDESCPTAPSCTPSPTPEPTRSTPEGTWDYVLTYRDGSGTLGSGTIIIGPARTDGTHDATCTFLTPTGADEGCRIYTSGDPFNWRTTLGITSNGVANFAMVTHTSYYYAQRLYHFDTGGLDGTTVVTGGRSETYANDIITMTRR